MAHPIIEIEYFIVDISDIKPGWSVKVRANGDIAGILSNDGHQWKGNCWIEDEVELYAKLQERAKQAADDVATRLRLVHLSHNIKGSAAPIITNFVTMYHAGPSHDWIFTSYHKSPTSKEQIANELHANGYTVQRCETDGNLSAYKDGVLVAVIQ